MYFGSVLIGGDAQSERLGNWGEDVRGHQASADSVRKNDPMAFRLFTSQPERQAAAGQRLETPGPRAAKRCSDRPTAGHSRVEEGLGVLCKQEGRD